MSSRSPDLDPAFLGPPLAHRGLHDRSCGRIENSRAAIETAVAAGYGIEIDIQPAACGTPMVFHDDTLDRLTRRTGRIDQLDATDLARISLTGSDETIPTLREILDLVAGRAALLIEIKDQDRALGPNIGALESRVAGALAGYAGPVAVMSFNPHAVAAFAAAAPSIPRGLVTCAFDRAELPEARRRDLRRIADFDRVGAAFVSHDRRSLEMPALTPLRERGVPILCWTVRSPVEEAAARRLADNITFEGYRPATRIDPARSAAISSSREA